eukprot:3871593-Pleurochrysis_carterae.AAC.1
MTNHRSRRLLCARACVRARACRTTVAHVARIACVACVQAAATEQSAVEAVVAHVVEETEALEALSSSILEVRDCPWLTHSPMRQSGLDLARQQKGTCIRPSRFQIGWLP